LDACADAAWLLGATVAGFPAAVCTETAFTFAVDVPDFAAGAFTEIALDFGATLAALTLAPLGEGLPACAD
jgi:hypothetical protein